MHYYFLGRGFAERGDLHSLIYNAFGVIFDIGFVFLLAYVFTRKRLFLSISTCFFITLFWSFANILYSRFFSRYITTSVMGQSGSLLDPLLIKSIISELKWGDIYFLLSLLGYVLTMRKGTCYTASPLAKVLTLLFLSLGIDLFRIYTHRFPFAEYSLFPNSSRFTRGEIRSIAFELYVDYLPEKELTKEELEQIGKVVCESKSSITPAIEIEQHNIIFILVESYMSFVSDMKVTNKEITPFLNELKRDSTVYFNGRMHENVTMGESSDGQFIYMTGLLPLRSKLTISEAHKRTMPGLPRLLRKTSQIIIPTSVEMWMQNEMSPQYGFESLYSEADFISTHQSWLNDNQVFQLAMHNDSILNQPFLSVILTMSMHQPYTEQIDSTFLINESEMQSDLACYLNACHYTDRQIALYFEHLKRSGLYDSSLIVIAADHPVHNTDFGGVRKEIPLYLVNVPKEVQAKMWKGECNQVDVYTTLLDLLGVDSDWYGLGHSLLSPDYNYLIDEKKWEISEWIIRGNYFSKRNPGLLKHEGLMPNKK